MGDELLSLIPDALSESHDRDYRGLCIYFVDEFGAAYIRERVSDISSTQKCELAWGSTYLM